MKGENTLNNFKDKTKLKFLIIPIVLIIFPLILSSCNNRKSKGIFINKWDNFYEDKYIHFYYDDGKTPNGQQLKSTYKLDELVASKKDELEKSSEIISWIQGKIKFSKNSISSNKDALSILEELKNGKTGSDKEYAEVFTQSVASLGIYSRIGEYKIKDSQHEKDDTSFKVCEIWSSKYKKWVMFDVVNNCYMAKGSTPLSAIEILKNDLNSLNIVGIKDKNKYIKEYNKYFYSYTINIDNNINDAIKSNSSITFIPPGNIPEIKTNKGYIPPTIFVTKEDLFSISPLEDYNNDYKDKKCTLILSKKNSNNNENLEFYIGAFKNSVMLDEYYISINGANFIKVKKYYRLNLKNEINTIRLSEDGKNIEREVMIQYKK